MTLPATPTTPASTAKPVCLHKNTKRPFNDHTLICTDCKKDITDTQDTAAAPKPIVPVETAVTVPTA